MSKPVVLDLETKYSFREKGKNPAKLGVSIVGIYDYETDAFKAFLEDELEKLFTILEHASQLIGFNIKKFDLPVLQPYYPGNLLKFAILDILGDVKKSLGKRIALDELVRTTLGAKKSGHGLLAINYYREGKIEELKKYCLDDVKLTKDLYEYGKKHGRIFYQGLKGKEEIKVDWQALEKPREDINLTLPI